MARRDRRREKLAPEDQTPEIVEEKLWSLSDWMEEHWKVVVAVLVTVGVVWGGFGVWQIISSSRDNGAAEKTAAVFEQAQTAVVPPPPKEDKPAEEAAPEGEDTAKAAEAKAAAEKAKKDAPPSFASEKERAEAVVKVAATAQGDAIAGVLVGAAKAELGDAAGQLAGVDAALAKAQGTALELPLRIQRAQALAASGKSADAAAEWAKVQAADPTAYGKALAEARQGDLAGDPAQKKGLYEGALKTARAGSDKDPTSGALGFLAAELRQKLARL